MTESCSKPIRREVLTYDVILAVKPASESFGLVEDVESAVTRAVRMDTPVHKLVDLGILSVLHQDAALGQLSVELDVPCPNRH